MTILSLVQQCTTQLMIPSPSSVIGNTDNNIILIRSIMERTARDIANDYPWPELQKEYTFTLTTSASYPLPSDMDRMQFETLWNRTQHWPMIGPVDSVAWQQYKSGLVVSLPRQRFRVKGWATNQFFIDPTPDSGISGQTMAFEYISRSLFRPRTWATGTVFAASSYCSYNGNIYSTTAGGTTGATPPTHTTGSASDGGVTWVYFSTAYESIVSDTDESILDPNMLVDGTVWRFKMERGLEYQELKKRAEDDIEKLKTHLQGSGVLSFNRWRMATPMIGPWNYPEGNYGI